MLQSWTIKADAAGLATQNLDASTMDSGVYFYRMESAGKTVTGKLIRVK
ncbi:MAG: T9SS type A sorting domain-containing protein [Candidatus Cloacimonetes bacterium]|nr:T9SS type A sorting domain-containing protein [Candidatus Cloacimonadota bacterium]